MSRAPLHQTIIGTMNVDNIVRVFRNATESQVARGVAWYPDALVFARSIGSDCGTDAAAGIIAALSPQLDWAQNMVLASRAIHDGFASGTIPANCRKAERILAGEDPLGVLGGPKVRAFYSAIIAPTAGHVVVDRHAFDIAAGRVTDDASRNVLGRVGAYDMVADLYRQAADVVGYNATEVQAVTWTAWRETSAAFAAANVRAAEVA